MAEASIPSDTVSTKRRGQIFAWTLFDFANTAFSVIIVTVIYSRYFTNHVAGGQHWPWGLAVSLVHDLRRNPLSPSGRRGRLLP